MNHRIYPINWEDGMKINKSHFIHVDQYNQQQRQKANALQVKSYNFGFCKGAQTTDRNLIRIEDDNLVVESLRLLFPSGLLAEFDQYDNLRFDLNKAIDGADNEPRKIVIAISCDPKQAHPVGNPFPAELPPRLPFLSLKPEFVVMKADQTLFSSNLLPICRIDCASSRFKIDEDYLPPCAHVTAHHGLSHRYDDIVNSLGQIALDATEVIQKARVKKRHGEINALASHTIYLLEKIVFYLAENIQAARTINKEDSPIKIFLCLNNLGRIIMTGLRCLKSVDKEALLRYYESHVGLTAHQFENDIRELGQLEYRHTQLNNSFDQADKYINTLRTFTSRAVDLE